MKQPNQLPTKIKLAVSSKVVLAGVAIAVVIGLSLVISTLVTPLGGGNFYAGSGDISVPPTPTSCCEIYKDGEKWMTKEDCSGRRDVWCSEEFAKEAQNPIEDAQCYCDWCPDGYSECGPVEKGDGVCCNSANETCVKYDVVPLVGPTYYFCKPTCPPADDPEKTLKCTGSVQDACCNPNEEECAVSGLGIAYCAPKDCASPNCGGTLCCDFTTEECVTKTGVPPVCQPKDSDSCPSGETYCAGTGEYAERQRCCEAGTTCLHHPNGYPYCYTPL